MTAVGLSVLVMGRSQVAHIRLGVAEVDWSITGLLAAPRRRP